MKSVNASHILVKNEKDANNILARLEKGESFEALAKRFSKCPSGSKGGNLGWFGRGDMVPEFENACFNGKKRETSSARSRPSSATTSSRSTIRSEQTTSQTTS